MIQVGLGETFTATVTDAPDGIVTEIEAAIFNAENEALELGDVTDSNDADAIYEAVFTAPDVAGYYTIDWRFPDPDNPGQFIESESEELVVGLAPLVAWAPTREEVGALIRARTKILGGDELGTFNEDTRPTGDEVDRLIGSAVRRVTSAIGVDPCNDDLREDARSCAAIRTAMMIEQSYWPEQTTNAGSSFQSLRSLWVDDMKVLTESVGEQCGGGNGESVGGAGQSGLGIFDDLPLIGRSSPVDW